MATKNTDISHKVVHVIQPSETLSSRIKDAAAEIGPEAMSLEIRTAMTRLRPPPPSVKAVLAEFAETASVLFSRVAGSNHIAPHEIDVKYEVVVCQEGTLSLTGLLAVVIRLFEVESLEMEVSDSQGNAEQVDWARGDIAVLAGGSNVRLSKSGKLVCMFFTYKRRNTANDHANAGSKTTEP